MGTQQLADRVQINQALEEKRAQKSLHYPTTTFQMGTGDDPPGRYLTATVDVDDTDEVVEVLIDRRRQFQLEQGPPGYVLPVRTPERVARSLHAALARERPDPPTP